MKKILAALLFWGLIPTLLPAGTTSDPAWLQRAREALVHNHIQGRGISDPRVIRAMLDVPRHAFIPARLESQAYADRPLPIGEGQTISQPYIVALMTESLELSDHSRVLEIGTGSGYQAAILAKIAQEVYTIEIREKLYRSAGEVLRGLKFANVQTRQGDGYFGWEDAAPFDAIMITAAVDHVPPPLIEQLKDGGRLVLPLGNPFSYQNLVLVTKRGEDVSVKQITGVLFVPMTGYAMERGQTESKKSP
ncbi:MAG: protein-L-isoaspartate(D-aspartate) O-methyltransferase [Desulfobacterales bacterium]|nr:MAG: protein-L-isoaspartate(D-aspartate) O-methyltransferase [Desulfobacterales bacterium]